MNAGFLTFVACPAPSITATRSKLACSKAMSAAAAEGCKSCLFRTCPGVTPPKVKSLTCPIRAANHLQRRSNTSHASANSEVATSARLHWEVSVHLHDKSNVSTVARHQADDFIYNRMRARRTGRLPTTAAWGARGQAQTRAKDAKARRTPRSGSAGPKPPATACKPAARPHVCDTLRSGMRRQGCECPRREEWPMTARLLQRGKQLTGEGQGWRGHQPPGVEVHMFQDVRQRLGVKPANVAGRIMVLHVARAPQAR